VIAGIRSDKRIENVNEIKIEAGENMGTRYRINLLMIPMVILGLTGLFLGGCTSKSVLEETPQSTTVTVTASPSAVPYGSTAVVEARVEDQGTGLANQEVVFSVNPSNAGYFTPTVDTTDADGVAASIFTATSIGSAEITVSVNGTSISGSIDITVTESQQSGSGNVDVSVSPSLLLANGSDTSVVTITVRDDMAQPAPDSTLIKIVAGEKFVDLDENGYWSEGIDSLVFDANNNGQWDAIGLIPSTAITSGGTGTAVVNFISGNDAQTVYIKATVDDNGIKGSGEASLQLSPNATINSIFLASDSINLSVKQTGGIETALLYALGLDENGNPVPAGLTINFIITDGPGGGEHLGTVGYGPYQAVTNSQGVATAPIHSGTVSGTIRIRAYADTVLSNAAQVMVSAGPPAQIVVGSEFCNIDYWDNVGQKVEIVAVVSDIYMNPVNDSTVVYFTTDEGTMKSHEERTKDHEGTATTYWIAGTNVPSADGRVLVIAETAGGTVVDTGMFFNTHIPDTLIVTGVPASMPADGVTEAVVYVTGLDLNGNPVIGGTTFEADAFYLVVQGGTLDDGCYTSSDRVKIGSVTLLTDNSLTGGNDDGIGAHDVIYYWSGAALSTFNVALTTGTAYRGNSGINGLSSVTVGETVYYSVTIKDRFGNPLGDHTLNMTATGGVVTGATQETDSYGEANGFVWTAPDVAGDYTIIVTDTDPRGGIVLTKKVTVQDVI
jgi:adhesin/invasin